MPVLCHLLMEALREPHAPLLGLETNAGLAQVSGYSQHNPMTPHIQCTCSVYMMCALACMMHGTNQAGKPLHKTPYTPKYSWKSTQNLRTPESSKEEHFEGL